MVEQARSSAESLHGPRGTDAVLLTVALTGVSFSGPLIAATAAPALAIAFWRNAMGGGATAGLALLRRRPELRALPRRSWLASVLAGVALAVHFGTWIPSLTMTTVASSTALVCSQTVFTGLIALARGRRLPDLAWVGIGVATLGAALIAGADLGVSERALGGDLLAVAGGLAGAAYVTIGSSARTTMSATSYTAICYVSCAALLLAGCLASGVRLAGYSGNAWLKLVLITCCAQLLGHTLFNVVLRSISATVVSLAILVEVPGAALVAWLWLHQHPPVTTVPGLALLLVGLVLVTRSGPGDIAPDGSR